MNSNSNDYDSGASHSDAGLGKLVPSKDELEIIEDIKAMAKDHRGGMFWKRATARVALDMLRRCYEFA